MQTPERLEVEEQTVRPRLKAVPPPQPSPSSEELQRTIQDTKPSDPRRLEFMLKALAQILSLRAILLLALIGAFALAFMALRSQTPMSLGVLVAYCAFAILPIVCLEIRGKTA